MMEFIINLGPLSKIEMKNCRTSKLGLRAPLKLGLMGATTTRSGLVPFNSVQFCLAWTRSSGVGQTETDNLRFVAERSNCLEAAGCWPIRYLDLFAELPFEVGASGGATLEGALRYTAAPGGRGWPHPAWLAAWWAGLIVGARVRGERVERRGEEGC